MLTIPDAIQTMLTSKLMVGDNRPTGTLTIAGAPSVTGESLPLRAIRANSSYDINFDQKTIDATWYNGHWSNGFVCELPGGGILVSYRNTNTGVHYLALVDDWDTLLGGNNRSAITEYQFSTGNPSYQIPFVAPADGEVYLLDIQFGNCEVNPVIPCEINLYKSPDKGLSQTWDWQALLYTATHAEHSSFNTSTPGQILINGDDILVPFMDIGDYGGWGWGVWRMLYSRDGGVNWSTSLITDSTALVGSASLGHIPSIWKSGSKYFMITYAFTYTGTLFIAHSEDLATWTISYRGSAELAEDWFPADPPICVWHFSFMADSSTLYLFTESIAAGDNLTFTRPMSPAIADIDDLLDYSKWTLAASGEPWAQTPDDWNIRAYVSPDESYHLLLEMSSFGGYSAFVCNGFELAGVSIQPKAITISRSKGTASQATVVLDNKLGIYAPDSTGEWNQVIWLNKEITIKLGYGAELQQVFIGLIDEIYMSNYPAELTITARDYSKWALDQQPQATVGGVTVYAIAYANKTPEYIFTDLAAQAGWAAGDIHADVTGITLESIQFGHESIADCFQQLCEITGWEWLCDEAGDIYFRAATDPAAVSVYSFTEGVDIFSLDYRISDAELYRNIVVWTSDSSGATIKASGEWPAADYNNILAKKTLIINAGDLVTDAAGCAAIVAAESAAITPKVREVNFVAVGNPYIQIGDVIQVTETTTTISEYYRVLEISHQMSADGSPVFSTALRCYHFAMPA